MDELTGCQDHGCVIAKPNGMATNGGKCHCNEQQLRRAVRRLLNAKVKALEAQLASERAGKGSEKRLGAIPEFAGCEIVSIQAEEGHDDEILDKVWRRRELMKQ